MKKIFGFGSGGEPLPGTPPVDAVGTRESLVVAPEPTSTTGDHTAPTAVDVPRVLPSAGETDRVVKVELALRAGPFVVVGGWSIGPVRFELDGAGTPCQEQRFPRPDVSAHFGRSDGELHGWVLVAPAGRGPIVLEVSGAEGVLHAESLVLADAAAVTEDQQGQLGPAAGILAFAHEPFSPAWKALVQRLTPSRAAPRMAHGFLEAAAQVRGTAHAVVVGWALGEPGAVLWIEDEQRGQHPLNDALVVPRSDVHAIFGGDFGAAALQSGFVKRLHVDAAGGAVRLMALTSDGLHLLAEMGTTVLAPSPAPVARWLFGLPKSGGTVEQVYDAVTGPILGELIDRDRRQWAQMPVVHRRLGRAVADPAVSIIVPLYSRFDFVESQMVEWARDPWIRQHAELIYVLDDPALVEPFRHAADELHHVYGVPFQWVWGGVNRGFSGANNLGVLHAAAPRLLFLNSDVFPQAPGWLKPMVDALEADPEVGAVGPRLTFAEGGIQHAGMRFERLEDYGVWINRHPFLGLDPCLDPTRDAARVPALTGACLLVRAKDLEVAGGWDTGYLIGDFEDSDLCLRLRERGLASLYLPDVQLTHLERQSMSALGDDAYRQQVTLWNAVRHQRRWQPSIEAAALEVR